MRKNIIRRKKKGILENINNEIVFAFDSSKYLFVIAGLIILFYSLI